ncbi:SsgA family sporulation/cell division regulator [Modestobacter sp. SSW1-42]|uniref:SsgA family sporulation/cell division regulator n=1 Tax=Modestobacter sp. SSW1-42 TaxID=596372 RepID=UPI003986A838
MPAALVYDARDPFAVRVRFGDGGEDEFDRGTDDVALQGPAFGEDVPDEDGGVEWLLSRDLLRAGLTSPAGEGDVRLWPARGGLDVLFLQLRAPSGEALFELSAAVVGDFLRESEQLVAVGHESEALQVDDELSALLQGGSDPSGH